jgi:hypothetical protein
MAYRPYTSVPSFFYPLVLTFSSLLFHTHPFIPTLSSPQFFLLLPSSHLVLPSPPVPNLSTSSSCDHSFPSPPSWPHPLVLSLLYSLLSDASRHSNTITTTTTTATSHPDIHSQRVPLLTSYSHHSHHYHHNHHHTTTAATTTSRSLLPPTPQ